jgi:hypothetical protein
LSIKLSTFVIEPFTFLKNYKIFCTILSKHACSNRLNLIFVKKKTSIAKSHRRWLFRPKFYTNARICDNHLRWDLAIFKQVLNIFNQTAIEWICLINLYDKKSKKKYIQIKYINDPYIIWRITVQYIWILTNLVLVYRGSISIYPKLY